ncbi:lamin tail domain-containing protein [Cyclobacterium marinum]|uniref:lamin tail domain-containing protein n=1 Tax=Cyclobacterium marinum TaxID=104 RepID=UPI0030D9F445|tara:strand:+ start:97741 stop:98994 length:1254 start_codon:yes stop_codon:yes gene_type:complete
MVTIKSLNRIKFFLAIPLLSFACTEDEEILPDTVADEIYINEIYASGEDWIELYNPQETSVDLGGYTLSDEGNEYAIPSGTSIASKSYLVFLCNDLGTGLNTNFKLSSSGELVVLENGVGTVLDQVEFPDLDEGQSYARFPDGSGDWAITGTVTQGTSNGDGSSPAINSIDRNPLVPGLDESVEIWAELISTAAVAEMNLYYQLDDGTFTVVEMTYESGTSYVGTIPAISTEAVVSYYVEVIGTDGSSSYKPSSAPENTESYEINTDVLPQLFINEFMASNENCCPDTDSGEEEFDDWIEIYNAGTSAINIGGMYVSDDVEDPFMYQIPSDDPEATTIPAGGYLLLWADGSTDQGTLHLDFSLSSDGEAIGLFYVDGRTIDSYSFEEQSEDISFGRTSDGGESWSALASPSPGQSND